MLPEPPSATTTKRSARRKRRRSENRKREHQQRNPPHRRTLRRMPNANRFDRAALDAHQRRRDASSETARIARPVSV